MRISKMQTISGFWKNMTFTGNICKMRTALVDYLTTEGVNSQITDGIVIFEYDGSHFTADFNIDSGFPECTITYEIEDDDYESLDMCDKTYISDRVNTDMENHSTVYSFDDSIKLTSRFYFTSKAMMLELFCQHFAEFTQSLDLALNIARDKIKNYKEIKGRRIGFNTGIYKQSEQIPDSIQIAAKV